jgi:hypothetical protein
VLPKSARDEGFIRGECRDECLPAAAAKCASVGLLHWPLAPFVLLRALRGEILCLGCVECAGIAALKERRASLDTLEELFED